MAVSSHPPDLPLVRRLEAVGFRAWPASSVIYNGSWQVRLTEGHPSKRLNCVVPLDPSDHRDMDERLRSIASRFEDHDRQLVVRETPLAPQPMLHHLAQHGWAAFETVDVLTVDLLNAELPDTLDYLPSHDIGRFADACLEVADEDMALKPALAEILGSIKPNSGFFMKQDPANGAVATVLCVQDNDLAGILSLAVSQRYRRGGLGTEMLSSALRWARISGAKTAWLQVESSNEGALALYNRFGFQQAYSYRYWRRERRG